MVSLDLPEQNKAFADSVGADFVLLSDPGGKSAATYGVLSASGTHAQRWTFYIDQNGVVKKIDKNVQPGIHGEEIAETLAKLGFAKSKSGAAEAKNEP